MRAAERRARPGAGAPTALVTGGTRGIGLACARALVRAHGWRVVITGTDRARTHAVAEAIGAVPVVLDLADPRAAADAQAALEGCGIRSLDALVCNAGVQLLRWETTCAGVERTLAVNHLGHLAVLRALVAGPLRPRRVALVTSGLHDPSAWAKAPAPVLLPVERLAYERPSDVDERTGALRSYVTSKLCVVMTGYELARRWASLGVAVNVFDPGLVPGTGAARGSALPTRLAWHTVYRLLAVLPGVHTARESGSALASLVADPDPPGLTGAHVRGRRAAPSSPLSRDEGRQRALVEESFVLLDALGADGAVLEEPDGGAAGAPGPEGG